MAADRMIDALKALLEQHGINITKTVRLDIDTPRIYIEPVNDGFRLAYSLAMLERVAHATVAGYSPDSFDACVNAVKWQQKPLDCQGIELGGRGKIDISECDIPIPSGPIDIREFTCRRS